MKLNVTIPESLEEIKLKDYIKIVNLLSNSDDEHELVVKIKLASLVTGLSLEDIVKIPANELNDIFEHIISILNKTPKFEQIIKVDGIEYGFIPDMESLSTAEYLDLSLYFGNDIAKTTAILYRPIKQKVKRLYSIQDYKGIKDIEVYDNFPASAYVSCMVFFYDLMNDLLKTIPQYLEENLTEEQKATLEKNGAGILHLTNLLEEIDLNTLK